MNKQPRPYGYHQGQFIIAYLGIKGFELERIIKPESRVNPCSFEPVPDTYVFNRTYYGARYEINMFREVNLMTEIGYMHDIDETREILALLDAIYVKEKPYMQDCSRAYLRKHTLIQI